jgi:hypothetical protein
VDNVICQFLYKLQGNIYLNSDVKPEIADIKIESAGTNRVKLSNVRRHPPPPTTKLAVFYRGGFEPQMLLNATGYGTAQKYALWEAQIRHGLKAKGIDPHKAFQVFDFQPIGVPEANPRSQHSSTTYCRLFAQAADQMTLLCLLKTFTEFAMQHYSSMHLSLDMRTAIPRPYLAFYPALYSQASLP